MLPASLLAVQSWRRGGGYERLATRLSVGIITSYCTSLHLYFHKQNTSEITTYKLTKSLAWICPTYRTLQIYSVLLPQALCVVCLSVHTLLLLFNQIAMCKLCVSKCVLLKNVIACDIMAGCSSNLVPRLSTWEPGNEARCSGCWQ